MFALRFIDAEIEVDPVVSPHLSLSVCHVLWHLLSTCLSMNHYVKWFGLVNVADNLVQTKTKVARSVFSSSA